MDTTPPNTAGEGDMAKWKIVLAIAGASLLALMGLICIGGYALLSAPATSAWAINCAESDVREGDYEGALIFLAFVKQDPIGYGAFLRASALQSLGRDAEALKIYRQISLEHHIPVYANNTAWLLATSPEESLHNSADAILFAQQACAQEPKSYCFDTLAAAFADAGDFKKAVEVQKKSLEVINNDVDDDLPGSQARLKLYEAGQKYREPRKEVAAK